MVVSVIVPMFNAGEFLRQCVESILNQTYQDIEVFLVDDESTDNSLKLCEELACQDIRVHCIQQKHAGPATARNKALDRIDYSGYTMFVDADDCLRGDAIEFMIKAMGKNQVDAVITNFSSFSNDFGEKMESGSKYNLELTGVSYLNDLVKLIDGRMLDDTYLFGNIWGRLLKNSIIVKNNLRFPDGAYLSEDIVFMAKYLTLSASFFVADEVSYFKRNHDNNIGKSYDKIPVKAVLLGYGAYKELLSQASQNDREKLDNQMVNNLIGAMVRLFHPNLHFSDKEREEKIRYVVTHHDFKRALKKYVFKKGNSRLLDFFIRVQFVNMIMWVAKRIAKHRYEND